MYNSWGGSKRDVKQIRFTCRNGNAAANWKKKWLRFDPKALTVGLTLHEVAHIAVFKEKKIIKGGRGIHGLHFSRKLDELIKMENGLKKGSIRHLVQKPEKPALKFAV